MNNILESNKILLGISDNNFDTSVITHINGALMRVNQLGVAKLAPLIIDETTEWEDLFETSETLSSVKDYVHLKLVLIFDPPQTAHLIAAVKEQIKELEWCLSIDQEGGFHDD